MNTLLVFLVRRDQVAQLVAYVLAGLIVIALEVGAVGAPRLPEPPDQAVAACPAEPASVR